MNRLVLFIAVVCFSTIVAFAQDPLKTAPKNYKMEFENEWVKVVRVHYGAKEKIPAHDHTETGAAYIYLNDSGPVVFRHIGLSYGAVTRAAVKAGSFACTKPSRKFTKSRTTTTRRAIFCGLNSRPNRSTAIPCAASFTAKMFQRRKSGEGAIRERTNSCHALGDCSGKKAELSASATEPILLIALTPAKFKTTDAKKKSAKLNLETGKAGWLAVGQQQQFENVGDSPAELLRFDLKTKPVKPNPNEKEKPHAHPHD